MPLGDRFWSKVQKTPGCWLWTRSLSGRGYGQYSLGGRPRKAHRLAWEEANGPIPPGAHVLHTCDERRCVNPDHLYVGSNADNIADMVARNRRKGERQCMHKLKRSEVLEIRRREAAGESQTSLAEEFNVHVVTVNDIVHRRTWTHL